MVNNAGHCSPTALNQRTNAPPLPRCWIRQHRGTQGRARQPLKCAVFGCHEWEIYSCHQQGSLDVSVLSSIRKGSIPACAGEPRRSAPSPLRDRVHHRVCGGARPLTETVTPVVGPSPRVRGSRAADSRSRCGRGSIPACAGEPRQPRPGSGARWVHPRVCGGAPGSRSLRTPRPGPSPRVRGSRRDRDPGVDRRGSIPACAGEPARTKPRTVAGDDMGPSPRVRGSPHRRAAGRGAGGSIPACAGEPAPTCRWTWRRWVHPRVCGGARS